MTDLNLLLEEQIPGLLRYAGALTRDADQAEELVEDTIRLALAEVNSKADLRIQLLTMLHDVRDNPFRQTMFDAPASNTDPAAALTLSDLDRALGKLAEPQRAIILLIGLEGLTYAQTAAVLRMSVGALRSRLTTARATLRRALGVADAPAVSRAA